MSAPGVRKVILSDVTLGREEEEAVARVLQSGWISTGEEVKSFEREFAEYVGARRALAVTNGTAALHLALLALGIGPGDEVIVPSLNFVATANAILYVGAHPVFADITSPQELNLAPSRVAEKLTSRTRAILLMHFGGYPCDTDELLRIASKAGIAVIEDAAHSLGSRTHGRHLGTLGDVGCFSFFPNKNMTTGEGGMLVTDRDDVAERVQLMRSHGMTSLSWDRHRGHALQYDVAALGYNYRFDEVRAAIGRVQLRKLEQNNRRRAEIFQQYRDGLSKLPGVEVPFGSFSGDYSNHICATLLDDAVDRRAIQLSMRESGVQTSVHYPPVHQMSIYSLYDMDELSVTEDVGERELTLPLHPRMDEEDVEHVIQSLDACL